MRLLAIVVAYYPDPEEAASNIMRYIPWVDRLIIWDNTPAADADAHRIEIDGYDDRIIRMGTGENAGISYALNRALEYANENGFTHLLTMDQDSKWVDFEDYKAYIENHGEYNAIYGPRPWNIPMNDTIHQMEIIITSGTITPVPVMYEIGGWWENFKINAVDNEMCLRAATHGIKCYWVNHGYLIQEYGKVEIVRRFGRDIKTIGYPADRIYGMIRNDIILIRKYKLSNYFKKRARIHYMIVFPLKIILVEKNKASKAKAILKAFYDGLTYKLSPFVTSLKPL